MMWFLHCFVDFHGIRSILSSEIQSPRCRLDTVYERVARTGKSLFDEVFELREDVLV